MLSNTSNDEVDESSLINMVSDPRFDEDKALELLAQGVSIAGSTNIGDEDYYLGASILHGAYFSESKKKFFSQLLSYPEVDLNAVCDEGYQEETLHFDKSLSPGII